MHISLYLLLRKPSLPFPLFFIIPEATQPADVFFQFLSLLTKSLPPCTWATCKNFLALEGDSGHPFVLWTSILLGKLALDGGLLCQEGWSRVCWDHALCHVTTIAKYVYRASVLPSCTLLHYLLHQVLCFCHLHMSFIATSVSILVIWQTPLSKNVDIFMACHHIFYVILQRNGLKLLCWNTAWSLALALLPIHNVWRAG